MVGSVQDSALASFAPQWVVGLLQTLGTLFFATLLLWGLYRFVPNRFVPGRHAFIGALVTAFCLETARFLFAWYMGNFDGYRSIYGAFAAHFGNRRGFGCGIAAENAFKPCFEAIPP